MPYSTLLFDLDHTLLDSDQSEAAAFEITMRAAGADPMDVFAAYQRINSALWAGVERGELQPTDVRTLRFERLFAEVGIASDVEEMATLFVRSLGANGDLYPGAAELLTDLHGRVRLGLVTNGLSDVQRARLQRLDIARHFDSIVISSEVGVTKPRAEIFDVAFEQLGQPPKAEVVMIGDSLSSDIRGGSGYGIATCWYNPKGRSSNGIEVTHDIRDLSEVAALVP